MRSIQIDFQKASGFSPLFLDYLAKSPNLHEFYNQYPDLQGFENIIKQRKFDAASRQILVNTLKEQYAPLDRVPSFELLLDDKTFTVTTGHQLNIFTGPLYVIYKIVSTIKLAKKLKEVFPEYTFVPVYWMASEDHDFEEINNFNLFGKNYSWQSEQKGAVGRMTCREISQIIDEMPEKPALFSQAYSQADNLSAAVRSYMHELFGTQGLVCVEADHPALKKQFAEEIRAELTTEASLKNVNDSTNKLEALGYKTQVSAREINLFYLDDQLRERIVKEEGVYKVLNTSLTFSEAEILQMVAETPEKFSPNVILRPVYQEKILPNIAYLGGPAEVVYWLQLKAVFDRLKVSYPIVMPRNFALYINLANQKKLEKLGLNTDDIWLDDHNLKQKYLQLHSENQIDFEEEKESIRATFSKVLAKTIQVDKSLEQAVMAEQHKAISGLENFEKRVKKAEERLHETGISQVLALKGKLFPGGSPQERVENYLNFALNNPHFIEQLFQNFNPLDFRFNILLEEN